MIPTNIKVRITLPNVGWPVPTVVSGRIELFDMCSPVDPVGVNLPTWRVVIKID